MEKCIETQGGQFYAPSSKEDAQWSLKFHFCLMIEYQFSCLKIREFRDEIHDRF